MPPSKKQKLNPSPAGKQRQYLLDNFLSLPVSPDSVQNGHVLKLYHIECHDSPTNTVKRLLTLTPSNSDRKPGEDRHLYNSLKRLTNKTKKLRKLNDPAEFRKYSKICCEKFPMVPVTAVVCEDKVSSHVSAAAAVHAESPSPEKTVFQQKSALIEVSPLKTRSIAKTTSCKDCSQVAAAATGRAESPSPSPEKTVIQKNNVPMEESPGTEKTVVQQNNFPKVAAAATVLAELPSPEKTMAQQDNVPIEESPSTEKTVVQQNNVPIEEYPSPEKTVVQQNSVLKEDSPSPSKTVVQQNSVPLEESSMKTRSIAKCTPCKVFNKTAQSLNTKLRKQQTKTSVKLLKTLAQKKKSFSVKRLNQQIKRLKIRLAKSTAENVLSSPIEKELASTKKELTNLKKKHKQMKKYHKEKKSEKRAQQKSRSEVVTKRENRRKDDKVISLQNDNLELEENLEQVATSVKSAKSNGKTYSFEVRMMVFDALICQTPTEHIPTLIQKLSKRTGANLENVPSRTTVEAMTHELGCISDLQTAEALMQDEDSTMGFDTMTLEGTHLNSIRFTTPSACYEAALDELPEGTADDYHTHICDTVDNLAHVYSYFHGSDYEDARTALIGNISNTITDRYAANHTAVTLVNETWNKNFNPIEENINTTKKQTKIRYKDSKGNTCGKGEAVNGVPERQYSKYFEMNAIKQLLAENKSAPSHNINAEEVLGMFSALHKKSPSATLSYISCKLRATRNKTVDYLDAMDRKKRDIILKKAIKLGVQQRRKRRSEKKADDVMEENDQERNADSRKKLEKKLKSVNLNDLSQEFPNLQMSQLEKLKDILGGKCTGHRLCHIWYENGVQVPYYGKIMKVKGKENKRKYVISYWSKEQTVDDAKARDMSVFAMASDFILGDLTMII